MNNYSELSDFEINKLIAEILYPGCAIKTERYGPGECVVSTIVFHDDFTCGKELLKGYCGNPADSWKLMVDNGISFINRGDGDEHGAANDFLLGSCESGMMVDFDNDAWNENPGRAVAECFLMIKGGEV